MTNRLLASALAWALASPALAGPVVSGDGACGIRAVDNESFLTCDGERAPEPVMPGSQPVSTLPAAIAVTAAQAWQIKKDLGWRALLVDIRARGENERTGRPSGADATVPFTETGPAPEVGRAFLATLDARLAAAGLGFGDPVILLCHNGDCSRLAAELMREHGYLQLFAVTDGFDGWNVASGYGRAARP